MLVYKEKLKKKNYQLCLIPFTSLYSSKKKCVNLKLCSPKLIYELKFCTQKTSIDILLEISYLF